MTDLVTIHAPVRLDFAGGWTDVPPFSEREGGVVVSAAINRFTRVEVSRRTTGFRLIAEDIDQTLEVADRAALAPTGMLALLQAAVLRFPTFGGLELHTRSDTPLGSGLGTSGSLGTALVVALARLDGRPVTPLEAADLAWRLESIDCRLPGGRQDQYAAALGGFHRFAFQDPTMTAEPIPVPSDVRAELERRLVVCYVGQSRVSGDLISRVMEAYEGGEARVVDALHEMKTVAEEMTVALTGGDLTRIGALLSRNWACQQRLDPTMQTERMQQVETQALRAGALGGKASGAGAGGCMFFVAGEDPEAVARAVAEAGATVMSVRFERNGVREC